MRSLNTVFLTACFVFVIGVSTAFSQASSSTAELRGQVIDSAGAALPNATVTVTDISKGTSRTVNTDDTGNYVFLNLAPSSYDLKVEGAAGFAPSSRRIELTVGQQANIPIQLGVGGIEEKVDVVAGAEVVDTDRT